MALTPNQYLTSNSNVILRNQQHASRMFTDDALRLAPKVDFLFHVSFSINTNALRNITLAQRHKNEINMLVKSASLPNFTVKNEVLNQYNRTKVVQYRHEYGEVDITFHDDNMGLINQLWQNYYSYYYADPQSSAESSAYNRNAMLNYNYITKPYGLDNKSSTPFFNYIKIYQMAKHEYVSYKLINPVITYWNHNKVNYAENKSHDFTMRLRYEAVNYGCGVVSENEPEGFGVEHYDTVSSPLMGLPDNSNLTPTFSNQAAIEQNARQFITNMISTVNTYENTKTQGNSVLGTNLISILNQGVSGIQGIVFPTKRD